MSTAPTIYLNGKFTAQRTTGVQRVAAEVVHALDAQVTGRWVLLCPPQGRRPSLQRIEVRCVGPAGLPPTAWEQLVLPWVARDGVIVNLAGAAPALARRQACVLHDAAVFDHPEAYTPRFGAWYRWLFRRLALRSLALFTPSTFSRERLALHLHVPSRRFVVVPLGGDHLDRVDPDEAVLERYGLRPDAYWLAVGSANPTKNHAALLEAFVRLSRDVGGQLVIVGARNDRVFAGDGAIDPPGVLRVGALEDAPLKALYRHARALVFPSLYEGFGLPPLEAMACGCPVAAAHAASIPEVCGDAALYFDPRDIDAIAAAMRRLCTDASLRAVLAEAGHRRAEAYRWSESASAMLTALREAGLAGAAR
jgi:glycosyltransferase involved in cell wall biosynthesis